MSDFDIQAINKIWVGGSKKVLILIVYHTIIIQIFIANTPKSCATLCCVSINFCLILE